MNDDYVTRARRHASRWKATTTTLPEGARGPAAYLRAGQPRGMYPFWLPAGYATYNLLPDIRDAALAEFATKAIAWHGQTPLGPTNHLLSSQVQCVNALEPMAHDPELLKAVFAAFLDIDEPLAASAKGATTTCGTPPTARCAPTSFATPTCSSSRSTG